MGFTIRHKDYSGYSHLGPYEKCWLEKKKTTHKETLREGLWRKACAQEWR